MICIHLWRGDQLAAQLATALAAISDEEAAKRAIDQLITEVHAGKYGRGTYTINAFHSNDIGAHLRTFWDSPQFSYPRATATAA
jgi:hypothetical protein